MIDTSVAIAVEALDAICLPKEPAISALTLAELMLGLAAASSNEERARRQAHLRSISSKIELLEFDRNCASAFGLVSAATLEIGRKVRGSRTIDLMIAATALAHGLPIYTRNASDLRGLSGLIEIVDLS